MTGVRAESSGGHRGARSASVSWLLVGIALLLTLVVYRTCVVGTRIRTLLEAAQSPSRQLTAYVASVSFGGPTVGFDYEVVVEPTSVAFSPDRSGRWIWRSYEMQPVSVSWKGDNEVHVRVSKEDFARYRNFIKTRPRLGVTAFTDPE